MNFLPVLVLIAWQLASRLVAVAPLYPSNAFHGGNIVAVIQPSQRSDNEVTILYAEPPFVDVVQTALTQWRFPRDQNDRRSLVVINFRDWDIEPVGAGIGGIEFKPHSEQIDWAKSNGLMPVPKLIIDPLYPDVYPNKLYAVPGGAVILHLEIDSTGTVKNAQILQGILDEFNQAALEAVQKWRFAPAQDESGKAVDSKAYAVCVYRPLPTTNPLIQPSY
jgi:TonB family protein